MAYPNPGTYPSPGLYPAAALSAIPSGGVLVYSSNAPSGRVTA